VAQILPFPIRVQNSCQYQWREAFFIKDGIHFALMLIDKEEMDRLIRESKRFTSTFFPYPQYVDRLGRVFPNWNKSQIVYR
jgi:hypothetical protein